MHRQGRLPAPIDNWGAYEAEAAQGYVACEAMARPNFKKTENGALKLKALDFLQPQWQPYHRHTPATHNASHKTALPPDVRQGSALPVSFLKDIWAMPPVRPLALKCT